MSKPLVCSYLTDHTLQQLEDEHGIKAFFSKNFDRFSLNYKQYLAKSGNKISDECRGLVLRPNHVITTKNVIVGPCEILSRPFDRFYNHGEECCANIDMGSVKVFDKLDGTMIAMYHDGERWCASTRSSPKADNNVSIIFSFSSLFFKTLEIHSIDVESSFFNKQKTYIFELTTPLNQVIVNQTKYNVTLLGIRNTITGVEDDITNLSVPYGLKLPNLFEFDSIEHILKFVNEHDHRSFEGVVLCDKFFNRKKVKNLSYVISSKLTDSISTPRSMLRLILDEKIDDALQFMIDTQRNFALKLINELYLYAEKIDKKFQEIAHLNRKELILSLKNEWFSPYIFMHEHPDAKALDAILILNRKKQFSDKTIDLLLSKFNCDIPNIKSTSTIV